MLEGSFVALVTPMFDDGSLDLDRLDRLINWHIEQGTQGLVVIGTTGESATLSSEERGMMIRKTLEVVHQRIPVMAGTGSHSTDDTVFLTKHAASLGVDACLVVTPYYNRPTQEGLYLHYEKVTKAVDIPIILYNVPKRTACDLKPSTVAQLATIPNIVGLKEATAGTERLKELRDYCNGGIQLYSGDDASACDFMLESGDGVISVMGNLAPKLVRKMCDAALSGRFNEAKKYASQLEPIYRALGVSSNPIPVKWALHEMGFIPNGIRLPLTKLAPKFQDTVRSVVEDLASLDTLASQQTGEHA